MVARVVRFHPMLQIKRNMKQVFNKITNKFEFMQESTATELLKKDKIIMLKDNDTVEVVITKDVHIDNKRYREGTKASLLVVTAHKWAGFGYLKILKKTEKVIIENKLEKKNTKNKKNDNNKL